MKEEGESKPDRYRKYLDAELEAMALYSGLADAEIDTQRAEIFRELAGVEKRHAKRWADKLGLTPEDLERYRPGFRIRMLHYLARRFNTRRVMSLVLRIEKADTEMYAGDPEAEDIISEERRHSRILRSLERVGDPEGQSVEPHRNVAGSGTLRAAVLGVNDGLVSNLGLVMGVTGGTPDQSIILLAGMAGLLAGAFSMASGEYISMRAQRDRYEYLLDIERGELEEFPDEEREELVLIYQAKGLTGSEARTMADRIMQNPEIALDTMAREELGLDPRQLGAPVPAAASSLLAFAAGASVPVLPHALAAGNLAFAMSIVFSALALVLVGGLLSALSGKNVLWGSTRMLIIGVAAAALTFGLGAIVGEIIGTARPLP